MGIIQRIKGLFGTEVTSTCFREITTSAVDGIKRIRPTAYWGQAAVSFSDAEANETYGQYWLRSGGAKLIHEYGFDSVESVSFEHGNWREWFDFYAKARRIKGWNLGNGDRSFYIR